MTMSRLKAALKETSQYQDSGFEDDNEEETKVAEKDEEDEEEKGPVRKPVR